MAVVDFQNYVKFLPTVQQSPNSNLWLSYDSEADVLYVTFKQPSAATDSDLTEDDVIVRYEGDEVIGLTILHASAR